MLRGTSSAASSTEIAPPHHLSDPDHSSGLRSCLQMSLSGNSDRQTWSSAWAGPGLARNDDRFAQVALDEDDSSLAVENGTSFNSSRHEQDESDGREHDDDSQTEDEPDQQHQQAVNRQKPRLGKLIITDNQYLSASNRDGQQLHSVSPSPTPNQSVDPNLPVVCETINDFCARHTREELEFLVGQISHLKISECYYSERSSTLSMVIEIEGQPEATL